MQSCKVGISIDDKPSYRKTWSRMEAARIVLIIVVQSIFPGRTATEMLHKFPRDMVCSDLSTESRSLETSRYGDIMS